jgi:5-hydroxyisourate hydrolase
VGISTHILDTTRGKPAANVAVELTRDGLGVAAGVTDADGRVRLTTEPPRPGAYRLTFAVGPYLGPEAFYPEVVVAFHVREGAGEHFHVPLLLNPYGYSTYRGS